MKYFLFIVLLFSISINLAAPSIKYSAEERVERFLEYQNKIKLNNEVKQLEKSEFSTENLVRYLELIDIDNKDILLRQAILETGWFKSKLFKDGNNLFGMRVPKVRESVSNGSYLGHAKYNHWTDSIKDQKLWQQYYKQKGKSLNNYYTFLEDVGYASSDNYIKTLKNINLNRFNEIII